MKPVVVFCLLLLVGCSKPAPTVSLSANPASVQHGQCVTLTWSSTNASTVSIDQGVGQVDANGSEEVCPLSSTQYTITAAGEGGSEQDSTAVGVTTLATAVVIFPAAALFESGKSELKPEGREKVEEYREQAKDQMSRADHVLVTGYTDNVGGADANSALSQQRAAAVRDHLISLGADPQKFQISGEGEAHPIADNSTEEGRAQNRRVEVAVVGAEK